MNHKEHIQSLFNNAKTNYQSIKANIENQVVHWFWATNSIFELEPFYLEQNRFPKGKILKEKPSNTTNKICYGVDNNDNIIVKKSYNEIDCYETFYVRNDNEIISYHFNYSPSKNIINTKKYIYENNRLTAIYSFFANSNNSWEQHYFYENNKMFRQEWHGVAIYAGKNEPFHRTLNYTYDEIGVLNTISEQNYIHYQKPDKKLSYKKLSELVSEKLLSLLKTAIANHAPKETLYCINIGYQEVNIIPPMIGFGTTSDRDNWANDEYYHNIIWNIFDYTNQLEPSELECDDETIKLFDLFNQETEINNKNNLATKLIVECAKQIKCDLSELNLDVTDDFVIIASDFEQINFRKNFKQINHELFDTFKNQLPK